MPMANLTEFLDGRSVVARFDANTRGTDYVTGDIHGSYSLLAAALAAVGFDPGRDRLFCVGDLVDRGPESAMALDWLQKPWFHACMGNHDAQYAFPGCRLGGRELFCSPADPWFISTPRARLDAIRDALAEMPWAIEVARPEGRPVGIVHAGVPDGYTHWRSFTAALEERDETTLYEAIWSRGAARLALKAQKKGALSPKQIKALRLRGISHSFHGHTRAKELDYRAYSVANRHYIDTAACKVARPGRESTLAKRGSLSLWRLDNPARPVIAMNAAPAGIHAPRAEPPPERRCCAR